MSPSHEATKIRSKLGFFWTQKGKRKTPPRIKKRQLANCQGGLVKVESYERAPRQGNNTVTCQYFVWALDLPVSLMELTPEYLHYLIQFVYVIFPNHTAQLFRFINSLHMGHGHIQGQRGKPSNLGKDSLDFSVIKKKKKNKTNQKNPCKLG